MIWYIIFSAFGVFFLLLIVVGVFGEWLEKHTNGFISIDERASYGDEWY